MISRLFLLAAALWLLAVPPAVAAPEAAVDLSQDFIPVTQDFDGARLTVFGALRQAASHIVVVFEGPPATALVRPKVRKYGIWINDEAQKLENIPSFYAVLSSRPVSKITDKKTAEKLMLGVAYLPVSGTAAEGLLQNRQTKGFYYDNDQAVRIRDKKLFRVDVDLPPNVPVGEYKASIYEFAGGTLVASRNTSFKIAQTGLNGSIKNMAVAHAGLYAMLAVVMALGVGAGAAHLFRRMT